SPPPTPPSFKASGEVRWFKDGNELFASKNILMQSDGRKRILVIRKAAKGDMGAFTCDCGTDRTTAQLNIEVPPRVELGVNMKNLIVVKAGQNVFLDAEVFGKPLPKVSWKRDGVPLHLAEGMKMTQKKHVHLLELYSVTRKESGDYTILAENVNGSKYATIKVKVLDVPGPCDPPVITNITKDSMTHRAGSDVELKFNVTAKPSPTIEWLKDGRELKAGAQLSFKHTFESTSLFLRDTSRLNSGTYEVKVKNSLGSACAVVRLLIQGTSNQLSNQSFIYLFIFVGGGVGWFKR
uniref:Ig-like domain-containing protein n=1 Tax=Hippocampus comes TaxID=109280 RepID=A0A3Q2Y6F9_HIPCM